MPNLKTILFVLAVFVCSGALAQQLEMHRTLGGAHFMRDTVYLSHRQMAEILSVDPVAHSTFRAARNDYRIGGLLGFSGFVLVAIPVISAVAGGEPEWLLAGGGAALLATSVPFSIAFKRKSQAAIDGYNLRHVKPESRRYDRNRSLSTKLYFTGTAVSLRF